MQRVSNSAVVYAKTRLIFLPPWFVSYPTDVIHFTNHVHTFGSLKSTHPQKMFTNCGWSASIVCARCKLPNNSNIAATESHLFDSLFELPRQEGLRRVVTDYYIGVIPCRFCHDGGRDAGCGVHDVRCGM